ncbi:MAG: DUF3817 domain-containing protein [Actinomycetota bacterium]
MSQPSPVRPAPADSRLGPVLLGYRIMAFVTGTMLLLLVFVAMPLKYLADSPGPVAVIGTAHGFLFMGYLVASLLLGLRMRWPLLRLGAIMIAGTIPFMSFVAERSVTREARARGMA